MARTKNLNKSTVVDATAESPAVAVNDVADTINSVDEKIKITSKQLEDSDEIKVVSLIPNVSYKDSRTGDFYEWDKIGHAEYMTYDTLKNMWRNCKSYFRDMWLKPLDDRVINKFGLTKSYEKYEFVMEKENYTRENIKQICQTISVTPVGLKYTIYNKIKSMVVNGDITDIVVITTLERTLSLDLTSFLK